VNKVLRVALSAALLLVPSLAMAESIGQSGTSSVAVTSLPALPAGTNIIGGVYVYDSAGTNKLKVDSSGYVTIANVPTGLTATSNALDINLKSVASALHLSTNIDEIGGSALAFGQATMANSIPVVLASNESALPVTQSVTPWQMALTPQSSATYGLTSVVSTAVETGHIIKASAGNLYGFEVTTGATAGEVLVHNSTTVPSAGAVTPIKCYQLPANNTLGVSWGPQPLNFSTGISISFSTASTCFTQTNSSTAFISADAQ
jgi:hypothetical protein